ncbi:MAG: hypothetical protein ACYDEC_07215 [Bacteroidia bacterium]
MKSINDIIKSFDYSSAHGELLQQKIKSELNGLPTIAMKFQKERYVFRCRKHDLTNEKKFFYFESDISYRRDIQNIKSIGRCNCSYSSKFYGSIITEEVKEAGYAPSIFETSKLLRDNEDGYEIYSIGVWSANEDIELLEINLLDDESETNRERQAALKPHKDDLNDDQREFYELIGKEMSKKVKSNENEKYFISALTSEELLKEEIGIVYPPVQTGGKGMNVVFNPINFDKYFTLKSILFGEFFKFKQESFFNNLFICEDASIYPFKYVYANSCKTIPEIVNCFAAKNITPDYIISTLCQQLRK